MSGLIVNMHRLLYNYTLKKATCNLTVRVGLLSWRNICVLTCIIASFILMEEGYVNRDLVV